jgi:hypothetical protein
MTPHPFVLDRLTHINNILGHIKYKTGVNVVAGLMSDVVPYIQVRAYVENADTGRSGWSTGRKYGVSDYATDSEIVQTAFLACLQWETHECHEFFKYKGHKIFNPHYSAEGLVKIAKEVPLDTRPDPVGDTGKVGQGL